MNVAVNPTGDRTGEPGATKDLSRRHLVAVSAAGVVTVTGGKLTTYREMAADTVDALRELLPRGSMKRRSTRRLRLSGARRASGRRRSSEHRCTT